MSRGSINSRVSKFREIEIDALKRDNNSAPRSSSGVGEGLQKGVIKFIYASYNGIGYPRYRVLVQHKSSSRSTTHDTSPLRYVNVAAHRFLLDPLPTDFKNGTIFEMAVYERNNSGISTTIENPRRLRLFSRLSRDYKFSRKRVIMGKKDRLGIFENRGGCRGEGGGRLGWLAVPFLAVNVLSPWGTMEGLIASRSGEKSSRK